MQQTFGRENAKKYIITFIIGFFIGILSTVVVEIGEAYNIDWFYYFAIIELVGIILQIYATVKLRNVNKHYANALWATILDLLFLLAYVIVASVMLSVESTGLSTAANWLSAGSDVSEAMIAIGFVYGTNQLAEEDNKGMPKLAKIVGRGYFTLVILVVIFYLLELIPAIRGNEAVILTFSIIIIVFYAIRQLALFIFLIKSLFRVK